MIQMLLESINNLFSTPETVKYPFAPSPEPKGYRGMILYNEEFCIFCDKCENICPPGAIKFEVIDIEKGKKRYNYNPYLCIYCGACVDTCPKAKEGCLIQADKRTPVMGEGVVKNNKMGYFINSVDNPKDVEKKWRELEIKASKSRKDYLSYKKQKKFQRQSSLQGNG